MLTPQEVSERVFAKASFGGYNMSMVDEFLDVLTGDYTALYNENAVLKSKMKVLVDKVEEYRSTEEAMRKALMTAQKMADDLIREAEEKKAEIIRQAEAEAGEMAKRIRKEMADEEFRLTTAKNATAACVLKAKKLYEEQMAFLDTLDEVFPPVATQPEPSVAEAVQDIANSVQRLLEQEEPTAEREAQDERESTVEFAVPAAETTEEDEAVPLRIGAEDEDDGERTTVFPGGLDLDNLQFGKDYEIK